MKQDDLEKSKLWKQSIALAKTIDRVSQGAFPYNEQYTFVDPLHRTAIMLTSDIANAIGKGNKDAAFDYRYARGHLFTIKGLMLIAKEYNYLANVANVLVAIELIRHELDQKIAALEEAEAGI